MTYLQGGYYSIDGASILEHAFVVGHDPDRTTYFPCYGGTDRTEGREFPAPLWTAWRVGYERIGTEVAADLALAAICASGSPEWRDSYDRHLGGPFQVGDCSGILYGVSGVCHQMANRILYANNGPHVGSMEARCVVWPPSLSATWVTYGFFGRQLEFDLYWDIVKRVYHSGGFAAADVGPDPMRQMVESHFANAYQPENREPTVHAALSNHAESPRQMEAAYEKDEVFTRDKRELDIQLVRGEISVDGYVNALNDEFARYLPELEDIVTSGQEQVILDDQNHELVSRDLMLDQGAYQEFRSLT